MKFCTKCEIEKSVGFFNADKSRKDGYFPWCKDCKRKDNKKYRINNPNKIKEWLDNNPNYMKDYSKRYYKENREYFAEYIRRHNKENREWFRKYENRKKREDMNYKLAKLLRDRIRSVVKGRNKAGSAVFDLGCSVQELKQHLEFQFQEGMSWENHGFYGWHIDHIKPLIGFDLTDRSQFLEACHYTNLQPLWAKENLSKGGKLLK